MEPPDGIGAWMGALIDLTGHEAAGEEEGGATCQVRLPMEPSDDREREWMGWDGMG